MDKIAVPYRIALGALLVVAALWFTVLRPKPVEETPPPQAPGVAGLTRATKAAEGAVAKSNASAAKTEAAAGQTPTANAKPAATPAKAAATPTKAAAPTKPKTQPKAAKTPAPAKPAAAVKPKADAKDPSAPLVADLSDGHTLVLLFYNRKGSDDRAVRSALKDVKKHHGKVVVKAISAKQVGDYETITRGAEVAQTPTVLVIGKDKKAHPIVGFTYAAEIDQLVGDVLAGRAH